MKFDSLHFRKAISAALFVLLLVVVGMKNALAQNQVATLQHNDTITGVFYGQNAFILAHSAAVDGDIITLSSGTFNACDINKSIIIHGVGCAYDSITGVLPTIIPGNFSVYFPNCDICNATIEGIKFIGTINLGKLSFSSFYANNISFVKCFIDSIINGDERWTRNNNQFVDCVINSFSSQYLKSTSIINCVVRFTNYTHDDIHNCTSIYNSIVLFNDGLSINNLIAYNSIIAAASGHTVSNCTFFNCIGIETGETSLFEGQTVQNIMEVDSYEDVFETFDGTITYDNIYQLKNDIATSFLGHDGTEVGIYGGVYPYSTRLSYMIMRRCNVAGRTTVDDKLSVEIELNIDE